MTKKLEALFEFPIGEKPEYIAESNAAESTAITQEAYSNLEKIESALPQVQC